MILLYIADDTPIYNNRHVFFIFGSAASWISRTKCNPCDVCSCLKNFMLN